MSKLTTKARKKLKPKEFALPIVEGVESAVAAAANVVESATKSPAKKKLRI